MTKLELAIANKNEMLRKSAEYVQELSDKITAGEKKIAELTDALSSASIKLSDSEKKQKTILKREGAQKIASTMIEKGLLDPIKYDATVDEFVKSPDSLEKLSSLIEKISPAMPKVGSVYNSKKTEAEDEEENSEMARFVNRSKAEKIDK